MVLQKESIDDELEHFEDIPEEPEDLGNLPSSNSPSSGGTVALQDGGNSNHKENYNYNNEDCLNYALRAKSVNNGNKEKAQTPQEGSALPVAYNPRHREPSYW